MTKTRVTTSGKVEKIVTSSVPIFEVEGASILAPQEVDTNDPADATVEDVVPPVLGKKKKKRKRANDTVSELTS